MIFHLHGQALVGGIERRSLRDGPRLEHALHLQAKVVVQAGGAVLLHHKAVAGFLFQLGRRLRAFPRSGVCVCILLGAPRYSTENWELTSANWLAILSPYCIWNRSRDSRSLAVSVVAQFDMEASQTRDYGVAKARRFRAARPDPSLRKERWLGMTNQTESLPRFLIGCTT